MSDMVTCTIDGKEITVPTGTLIIRAAEQLGIEIPRFCDHEYLEPVGACRQCFVEVEGQRKLFTSCTTPVAEGWVIKTQQTSEQAKQSQTNNLEFLLINHPLDCPVCDRGGECPLQDQTMAHGPGASRFEEAKRTYDKNLPLSELVMLDRERCVLCARCTRFCDQISGDRFITLQERGASQQVQIAEGEDFASPFSGNTVQICPVGALTARTYRFVARPFDLKATDTVCGLCSAGCNTRVDQRRGEVVRYLARDNAEVNDAWMCDKGRFAFRWTDAANRLDKPLLRVDGGDPAPAPFREVFDQIKRWTDGKRIAFLTGGRLTNEDYYALSKLARTVFGTNDIDHRRIFGGGEAERLSAAGQSVRYEDVERAQVIVVAGLDAEQEVPILHLKIRKAVRRHGAKVFVVHPRATRLHDVATHVPCRPGAEAEAIAAHQELVAAVRDAGADAVVLGGQRLDGAADGVLAFALDAGARFAWVCRRANDHGALRAGVHPALLPGGRRLDDATERGQVEAVWGTVGAESGRDTRAILEAAAAGEIEVLYLVGVDLVRDFPDADLAMRALERATVIVQDSHAHEPDVRASAMLPALPVLEKDGHLTTWEGRAQRVRAARGGPGVARPDWEIFAGLAEAMGTGLGFATLDELREEMAALTDAREVAAQPSPTAAPAGDGTVLVTYPLLVDEARAADGATELKETQGQAAFAELHPDDAAALGVADGATVTVRTQAGHAQLPARVTASIARGVVFVPFNQEELAANTLLSGAFTATATVEGGGA